MPKRKQMGDDLFGFTLIKSQRTMMKIAEAAIANFAKRGLDSTTFETIAKTCKLSRTIVNRYFPEMDELILFSAKYIRSSYQQFVIDAFSKTTDPDKQLKLYVEASLDWADEMPDHARTWILFFYYCTLKKNFKEMNTDFVQMGYLRLTALIDQGKKPSSKAKANQKYLARQLHLYLSGAILARITESESSTSQLKQDVLKFFAIQLSR